MVLCREFLDYWDLREVLGLCFQTAFKRLEGAGGGTSHAVSGEGYLQMATFANETYASCLPISKKTEKIHIACRNKLAYVGFLARHLDP